MCTVRIDVVTLVNHRNLEYEKNKPFSYLGDTAWKSFYRLNREEAVRYLTNLAQEGFMIIQADGAQVEPTQKGTRT